MKDRELNKIMALLRVTDSKAYYEFKKKHQGWFIKHTINNILKEYSSYIQLKESCPKNRHFGLYLFELIK